MTAMTLDSGESAIIFDAPLHSKLEESGRKFDHAEGA